MFIPDLFSVADSIIAPRTPEIFCEFAYCLLSQRRRKRSCGNLAEDRSRQMNFEAHEF
jgi:hypothetical protein